MTVPVDYTGGLSTSKELQEGFSTFFSTPPLQRSKNFCS